MGPRRDRRARQAHGGNALPAGVLLREAEDRAEVLSLGEQVEVPFGYFGQGKVVMTRDLNPLKPKILEYKFYARGVGPVLAVGVSGGSDREELVSFTRGR